MWGMRILKRMKWMDLGNEDVEELKNKDAKDKVEMVIRRMWGWRP